jgi:ABC-2 type transport system permease protein
MNKIFAIAWKDALIRFSSRSELLFFVILPLAFTFIVGGGFSRGQETDNRVRLLVADNADTTLSAEVLDALSKSKTVRAEVMPLAEAEVAFADDEAPALLIIPAGFEVGGKTDLELLQAPNNLNAQVAERAVLAVISRVGSALSVANNSVVEAERLRPFASGADRMAYFNAGLEQAQTLFESAPERVEVTQATSAGQPYDPAAQASAGQLITWVFIPLLGISGLFAYEREQGTLRRLLTTPTQKATYLLGTISGQLVIALIQMALLVIFGVFAMGLNWGQSPLALGLMLVTFGLAASALGATLGTFIKSEGQASGLSVMLGMSFALMGGCWYPLELFPEAVRTAVQVLPTTWAMQGLLDIVLRGQDVAGILLEAAVLAGFAVVFFAVGVWRFRYE